MSKFNRWLRSKFGVVTITSIVVILVIVLIVGEKSGWWENLGLSGSAGVSITLPPVQYPDPVSSYTCLPTCSEKDGKFFYIANNGMRTFTGEKTVLWVRVPGNKSSFEIDYRTL